MNIVCKLWKTRAIFLNRKIEEVEYKDINLKDFIVIDVRGTKEFEEGHLNGAINIPLFDIKKKIEEIIPNKKTKILLYCKSGIRSKKAGAKLEKLGYENIYNLKGGIDNM